MSKEGGRGERGGEGGREGGREEGNKNVRVYKLEPKRNKDITSCNEEEEEEEEEGRVHVSTLR